MKLASEKQTNNEAFDGAAAQEVIEQAQQIEDEKWAAITCHGQHNVARSVHDLDASGYDLVSVSYSGHENIRVSADETESPVLVPTFLAIFCRRDLSGVQ